MTAKTAGMARSCSAWVIRAFASASMEASRKAPPASTATASRSAISTSAPGARVEVTPRITGSWKERSSTSDWKFASVTETTYSPAAGGGASAARAAASDRAFTAARSTAPAIAALKPDCETACEVGRRGIPGRIPNSFSDIDTEPINR